MVLNDDNTIVITSNRLSETGAPLLEQGMIVGQLALADALIIGNCNNQVKEIPGTWACIFGVQSPSPCDIPSDDVTKIPVEANIKIFWLWCMQWQQEEEVLRNKS